MICRRQSHGRNEIAAGRSTSSKTHRKRFRRIKQIEYLIDESLDDAYYGLPYGDTHPTALCTRNQPINIARAHQLLTEMWGDLINAEAIDNACERFVDIQTASCGNEATAVAWFIAVRVGKIAAEI